MSWLKLLQDEDTKQYSTPDSLPLNILGILWLSDLSP